MEKFHNHHHNQTENQTLTLEKESSSVGVSSDNWDETSFAKLLGLDEKVSEEEANLSHTNSEGDKTQELSNKGNVISQDELFEDPQLSKTQPNFASNPFAKFGAVGLVLLVVFGIGATFLNIIMSKTPKPAPIIATKDNSKPEIEINPTNIEETEKGKLKAELALGSQAEKIKSLERSKSPKNYSEDKKSKAKNRDTKPTHPTRVSKEENPTAVSYTQPVRSYPRPTYRNYPSNIVAPIRTFQPVINQPVANKPVVSQTPVNKIPTIASTTVPSPMIPKTITPLPIPTKEINPIEEWNTANNLGSFGSSEIVATSNEQNNEQNNDDVIEDKNTTPEITIPRAKPVFQQAIYDNHDTTEESRFLESSLPTLEDNQLQPLEEEEAIINGEVGQQLTIGGNTSAKLVNPLIWTKSLTSNNNDKAATVREREKFIIQLTKPLTGRNNIVVLPTQSQIIAQVVNIQKSGLVELEATQVIVDGKEYILPPGVISIRGNSGKPLIASKWDNKSREIASKDVEAFIFRSLGKVGGVLNQATEEQISTNTGNGFNSTFNNIRRGRRNILGAVLEGGFQALGNEIVKRNQQSINTIQQREEVWYLPTNTNLQVFVNKSFQF